MVTMKDVARSAGVSLGTVSHYLNNSVPVSPETAERIRNAVDALGYRVDQGARSLRRRQTKTVGLIVPNISNPFYAELARVLKHRLWNAGFQTFLCNSAHDAARERAHFTSLLERRADGILAIYGDEASQLPELAATTTTPVVFLDRPVAGQRSVASDNLLGDTVVLAGVGTLGLLMLQVIKQKTPTLSSYKIPNPSGSSWPKSSAQTLVSTSVKKTR